MEAQLKKAQDGQKINANVYHKEQPQFNVGDKVWLLCRNVKTTRPCDKLDYYRLGPFAISKQMNLVAYWLHLPESMKIHPVFHVSLLELYETMDIQGRRQIPPPPIEVDNNDEFEVEEILDSRRRRNKLEYLIHWRGYDISERTWEPSRNLANAFGKVKAFHQRHPSQPRRKLLLYKREDGGSYEGLNNDQISRWSSCHIRFSQHIITAPSRTHL